MRYTIVEPRSSGHLLVYVRLLCTRAWELGHEVIVATSPEARASAEWSQHLADLPPTAVRLFRFDPRRFMAEAISIARSTGADTLVVPHGDELIAQIGARLIRPRLPCPMHLLIMRDPMWEEAARPATRARARLKALLIRRAQRVANVHCVWLRPANAAAAAGKRIANDPYIGTTDIAQVKRRATGLRERLGMTSDVVWFLVTGAVTDRKNLPLILRALAVATRARNDIGFAVIGPLLTSAPVDEQYIRARCAASAIACVVSNTLLSNDEVNDAIAAADVVLMAYSTTAPNSTLAKAAVLGTKLVAAGPPTVQEFARSLGAVASVDLSEAVLADAILRGAAAPVPAPRPSLGSSARFADQLLLPPRGDRD